MAVLQGVILMGPSQCGGFCDSGTSHSLVLWSKHFARQASTSAQLPAPRGGTLGWRCQSGVPELVETGSLWPGKARIMTQKASSERLLCSQ